MDFCFKFEIYKLNDIAKILFSAFLPHFLKAFCSTLIYPRSFMRRSENKGCKEVRMVTGENLKEKKYYIIRLTEEI